MADGYEIKVKPEVNHVSIKVKNLKESVRFYHEILGLPIVRYIGPKEEPKVVFLPGVELSQREGDSDSEISAFFGHIGIAVENIEEVCKHLEEEGVNFDTPLKDLIFEEINQGLKLAFFKDPDRIPVELVQWRNL